MGWRELTLEDKNAYYRRYKAGEKARDLATEIGISQSSFINNCANLLSRMPELEVESPEEPDEVGALTGLDIYDREAIPTEQQLYELLLARPYSLPELSEEFDRSIPTIRSWIENLQTAGYTVTEEQGVVSFQKFARKTPFTFPTTLADQQGQVVKFAAYSDTHAGSSHAQPTNLNKFINVAYNEYGIRHFFFAGDVTQGVGGYKGIEQDMVPALRTLRQYAAITEQQIWLADKYIPQLPGATHYMLGGNHDYWHVTGSGIDAVYRLCARREDMIYLGYDVADIPLTDKVDIRLWHPSGGVPYALSYRLQKALEQTAFEELTRAITEADNPKLRVLLAGHTHVEVKFNRGPMLAVNTGCFEGQTNYLKRKALYPQIGGCIFKVWLSDGGQIQRVEYTFLDFTEIHDDWQYWPTPEVPNALEKPEDVGVLFHAQAREEVFQNQRPA